MVWINFIHPSPCYGSINKTYNFKCMFINLWVTEHFFHILLRLEVQYGILIILIESWMHGINARSSTSKLWMKLLIYERTSVWMVDERRISTHKFCRQLFTSLLISLAHVHLYVNVFLTIVHFNSNECGLYIVIEKLIH